MPRKVTSQWDFGELFPAESTRRVLSVTEITGKIRGLLEQQVGQVWVRGEITNLRAQSSGHVYFAIKDPNAQLSCVLFRGTAVPDRAALKDGQKVVVQGEITVYEPRGQYQMIVRAVEVQGIGALQAAFEQLKQRLNAEGLFDPARKRPLPAFPRCLGVVTSPTGAALRDVLHGIGRRYAGLDVVLAPCRVQGAGAELEIADALRRLNGWSAAHPAETLDVILVTRGGGSLEDLWAFNEEAVARAIAASGIPVVSAVGHEIDFTIADFVADLRAATPSAAAELLTAGYVEAREVLPRQAARLRRTVGQRCLQEREALWNLAARLQRAHPRRRIQEQLQRIDDLHLVLDRRAREITQHHRQRWERAGLRLRGIRWDQRVAAAVGRWAAARERLARSAREICRRGGEVLERLRLRLQLLSPQRVLERGYSITTDAASGTVVRRSSDLTVGQVLRTRLSSGDVTSVVAPDGGGSSPAAPMRHPHHP